MSSPCDAVGPPTWRHHWGFLLSSDDLDLRRTSVTNVLVTLITISIVDKVGRKPMLLGGSLGMALTLGAMAGCFSQSIGSGKDVSLPQPWGTIALIAANLYVVSFGTTWGPVVWVLLDGLARSRYTFTTGATRVTSRSYL